MQFSANAGQPYVAKAWLINGDESLQRRGLFFNKNKVSKLHHIK